MQFYCEQFQIIIKGQQRGCYSITADVEKKAQQHIDKIKSGTCHLFMPHTSAGLSLNDISDTIFRQQMALYHKKLISHSSQMQHNFAGDDDLPAHALTNIVGVELTINIQEGALVLGKWQGLFLNEFRDFGGDRKIVTTIMGQMY